MAAIIECWGMGEREVDRVTHIYATPCCTTFQAFVLSQYGLEKTRL